jgi:hypothetical protein
MTDMPTIKVKVTPIFPSAVTVDSPLLLDTTGGAYHFALDVDALSESIIIPLDGPSSQIGLTPVLGVSTTAMRSDAAPALDQSIDPTWTGSHTFNSLVKGNEAGPNFATLGGIHNSVFFSTNGFPLTAMFGQNTVPLVQTLVGGVEIPSSATFGNHCAGIAGYARTASTGVGAVGVYGQGTIGGTGPGVYSIFGANFVVGNTAGGGPGVGYDAEAYGIEIDVNLKFKTGAVAPSGNVRGIYIQNNGAEVQPTGRFNGVEVTGGATVPWKVGYWTDNGAASIGASFGSKAASSNTASQAVEFRSVDAGSTARSATISSDANGFLAHVPGVSAGHFLFRGDATVLSFSVEDNETRARQTTQSTSSTSGALRSAGGLGVEKNAFIGGTVTVGVAGSALGTLALSGNTSGTTTLRPAAAASGTLTLPAATDTLVGKATPDALTNKTIDTASASNTFKINGTTVATAADFQGALAAGALAFKLSAANFNSTADQAITLALPTGFTRYRFQSIITSNPSISLTTAVGGIYTAAAKGGIAIVAASTAWSPLTNSTAGTSGSVFQPTVVNGATAFYNSTTLYLSLTTPQGAAATADVTIIIQPLP